MCERERLQKKGNLKGGAIKRMNGRVKNNFASLTAHYNEIPSSFSLAFPCFDLQRSRRRHDRED
jgi:hypothetical protein